MDRDHSQETSPREVGDVPRRPLSFSVTRRELFRPLRPGAEHGRPEGDRPAYKLKTLGVLSDEELARITPVLVGGCRLAISDGMVWGWAPADETPRRLCAAGHTNLLILHAIDGHTSLGAISDAVHAETELRERSFGYVRALFLKLVLARMATPV